MGGLSARSVRTCTLLPHTRTRNVRAYAAQLARSRPAIPSAARAPESQSGPSGAPRLLTFTAAHPGALFPGGPDGPFARRVVRPGWADVDLDGGFLTVRRTITTVRHEIVEGDVKTKRSRRRVDLDPGTVDVLREHRKNQLEARLLIGAGYHDRGLVFANVDGAPWNPDSIGQAFKRLVASSGLPRISLHGLRHTHTSHLLAAGVNVKVVSERLGHASVASRRTSPLHAGQQATPRGCRGRCWPTASAVLDHPVTKRRFRRVHAPPKAVSWSRPWAGGIEPATRDYESLLSPLS